MGSLTRNPKFFGREDIMDRLDDILLPNNVATVSSEDATLKHVALCGMGGLGKTEIAIEYAFTRKDKFDAIFWIRADALSKLESDFSRIATVLGLEDPSVPPSQLINRDLAKGWLANPKKLIDESSDTVGKAEATWLLILDNADQPDILEDIMPIFGSGSILMTSRDPLAKTSFSVNPVGIDIEPFQATEAATFLRTLVSSGSEDDAMQIAHRLGYLPMALSQMAGVIRHQYLSFSDFLDVYEDESEHQLLYELDLGPRNTTSRGNIASIWAINRLSEEAQTLLDFLALLDPDCIQERIFVSKSAPAVSVNRFPKKSIAWNSARGELLQMSLIKRNEQEKSIRIHRLLQDAVKARMSTERASIVFTNLLSLISAAWPSVTLDQRHNTGRWQTCEELWPHILSIKNYYEYRFRAQLMEPNIDVAILLNEAGWFVFLAY